MQGGNVARMFVRRGTTARDLGASTPALRAQLGDVVRLGTLLAPPVDLATSQLGPDSPVWRVPPLRLASQQLRLAVLPRVHAGPPIEVSCVEAPESDTEVRLTARVDLEPRPDGTRADVVWTLELGTTPPRGTQRLAGLVVDRTVGEVLGALLERADEAARDRPGPQ